MCSLFLFLLLVVYIGVIVKNYKTQGLKARSKRQKSRQERKRKSHSAQDGNNTPSHTAEPLCDSGSISQSNKISTTIEPHFDTEEERQQYQNAYDSYKASHSEQEVSKKTLNEVENDLSSAQDKVEQNKNKISTGAVARLFEKDRKLTADETKDCRLKVAYFLGKEKAAEEVANEIEKKLPPMPQRIQELAKKGIDMCGEDVGFNRTQTREMQEDIKRELGEFNKDSPNERKLDSNTAWVVANIDSVIERQKEMVETYKRLLKNAIKKQTRSMIPQYKHKVRFYIAQLVASQETKTRITADDIKVAEGVLKEKEEADKKRTIAYCQSTIADGVKALMEADKEHFISDGSAEYIYNHKDSLVGTITEARSKLQKKIKELETAKDRVPSTTKRNASGLYVAKYTKEGKEKRKEYTDKIQEAKKEVERLSKEISTVENVHKLSDRLKGLQDTAAKKSLPVTWQSIEKALTPSLTLIKTSPLVLRLKALTLRNKCLSF